MKQQTMAPTMVPNNEHKEKPGNPSGADQKGRTGHFISAGFLWFVIFFFLKNI
jgi:hypothetical protein